MELERLIEVWDLLEDVKIRVRYGKERKCLEDTVISLRFKEI